jgi:enamine deaminase RidA (YjgF/YER057c/UK114 family)
MRAPALVALVCGLAILAFGQRKKKKEEETQTLQLPKDLPTVITGDTRHLNFYVTPLSAKGLLSQQIRDALKALDHEKGSDTVLKIRAFVAGSGDLRRVRDLVSEIFTDRRQPLPVLCLVRAGGLPLEGAQVVLEAVASSKKEVNPAGLAFFSAVPATSENPLDAVPPLTARTLASLRRAVKTAGAAPADVARLTCFLSSLENLAASRQLVANEYPRAAQDFVQTQRSPGQALAACEALARLRNPPPERLTLLDAEGVPREPGQSEIAMVAAPHLVLTGTQISFGYEEKDARLAFARLQKALDQAGASMSDVAYVQYYPLASPIAAQVRKIRSEVFNSGKPPAGTLLLFEGLPSMDAGFAMDVVAAKE